MRRSVTRRASPFCATRSPTAAIRSGWGWRHCWEKSPLCAAACFCRGTSRCSRSKVWKHWRWQRPPMPLCGWHPRQPSAVRRGLFFGAASPAGWPRRQCRCAGPPRFRLPCVRPERCRTEGCGYAGGSEPAASADKQIKIPCSSKKLHGIFYFITYDMIVNWQARMASSAPAQQSDKTSISVSGKAARSTMALLITQISVQ